MRPVSIIVLGMSLAVFSVNGFTPAFGRSKPSSPKKVITDPVTSEQLRALAKQSKISLTRISELLDQFKQSLPNPLPSSAQAVLNSISGHLLKATDSADEVITSSLDDEKLRFKMAVLTSEIEMIRSGLTRLKLGLNSVEIPPRSQAILGEVGNTIDELRLTTESP